MRNGKPSDSSFFIIFQSPGFVVFCDAVMFHLEKSGLCGGDVTDGIIVPALLNENNELPILDALQKETNLFMLLVKPDLFQLTLPFRVIQWSNYPVG